MDRTQAVIAENASKGVSVEHNISAAILRSLLQNEETLLRWVECVSPQGDAETIWTAQIASYKVTSRLVALAVAQRLAITAGSSDQRFRADEIQRQGAQWLRDGYRALKPRRDEDREEFADSTLSERDFSVSAWEESCSLAEPCRARPSWPRPAHGAKTPARHRNSVKAWI